MARVPSAQSIFAQTKSNLIDEYQSVHMILNWITISQRRCDGLNFRKQKFFYWNIIDSLKYSWRFPSLSLVQFRSFHFMIYWLLYGRQLDFDVSMPMFVNVVRTTFFLSLLSVVMRANCQTMWNGTKVKMFKKQLKSIDSRTKNQVKFMVLNVWLLFQS